MMKIVLNQKIYEQIDELKQNRQKLKKKKKQAIELQNMKAEIYQNAESVSDKIHLINDFEIMETCFVYNNVYYIYNESSV